MREGPAQRLRFSPAALALLSAAIACGSETPPPAAPATPMPAAARATPVAGRSVAAETLPTAPPRRPEVPGRRPEERMQRRLWWNKEETATAVGVTADQVALLEELARNAAPEIGRLARATADLRDAYRGALESGELERAAALAEQRASSSRELALAQSRLTIAGMRLLTAEQRSKLAAVEPLDRPWIQPGPMIRSERRPGGPFPEP